MFITNERVSINILHDKSKPMANVPFQAHNGDILKYSQQFHHTTDILVLITINN